MANEVAVTFQATAVLPTSSSTPLEAMAEIEHRLTQQLQGLLGSCTIVFRQLEPQQGVQHAD